MVLPTGANTLRQQTCKQNLQHKQNAVFSKMLCVSRISKAF